MRDRTRRSSLPASSLMAMRLDLPRPLGPLRILVAECDHGRYADRTWARPSSASNSHWCWYDIIRGRSERFVLVSESAPSVPLGFWCSDRTTTIQLEGRPFYRLDYLERSPCVQGGVVGPLLVALAAWRARELGAEAIVLAALPEPALIDWYTRLGATKRKVRGWTAQQGLVTLVIETGALSELAEKVNEIKEAF